MSSVPRIKLLNGGSGAKAKVHRHRALREKRLDYFFVYIHGLLNLREILVNRLEL